MSSVETLLDPAEARMTMFPLKRLDVWDFYQKALACFWVPKEVDLSADRFEELAPDEQHFVKYVLAFFAASDNIVNENLELNFAREVVLPEAKAFLHLQEAMEDVHSTMYSTLLSEYVKDPAERDFLVNAVTTVPCIRRKAEWARRWMDPAHPFHQRLVAFAIVEGVFFSGCFCAIFWLAQQNKMPGLCKSNEFIARDEGLHTDFACLLYKGLSSKLADEEVHTMVREAIEIETGFVNESLPCALLGMNAQKMAQYVRYVADILLHKLGHPRLFAVKNPFAFMELIDLEGRTNFFEHRTTEYQKAHVLKPTTTTFLEVASF